MAENKKTKVRGVKKVVIAEVEKDGSKEGCPFHFGLKTYLRNIVEHPQEKEIIETVDYLEESDFMSSAPSNPCRWDKAFIWCGVPLLIFGVTAVLIGQFLPPRDPVVAMRGTLAYLDKSAILFNSRLEMCHIIGLFSLCAAAIMIILSFLISAYTTPPQDCIPVVTRLNTQQGIPLSGVLRHVQPPSLQVPPKR